jgi:hypothetical protein
MLLRLLLMAFTISSSVGTAQAAPTGRSTQGHLVYAVNQGAYWTFFLSSTNALSALYSTNSGGAWNTPTGSPFTLANAHNSEGRNFGFAYANLSSTDILHMASSYVVAANDKVYHTRFTLGTTLSNTNAEAQYDVTGATGNELCSGAVCALDSNGKPIDASNFQTCGSGSQGNGNISRATNNDAGTSWTAGYPNGTNVVNGASVNKSNFVCSLGSGNVLYVADGQGDPTTFTDIQFSKWVSSWSVTTTALAGTVTATNGNNWGACAVTTSDVHLVVLSNNSNAFVHRRFNGTSWSNSSGAPGALTLNTSPSGIALVSDNTNLYAAAIDSSKNIKVNTWTSAGGWAGWTTLETARTNTPSYITGVYNPTSNEIMWAWTELNGTQHDIIGSVQTLTAPTVNICHLITTAGMAF